MYPYLSLEDVDLYGKTVILRVDFNSTIDTGNGAPELTDTKRIDDHIKTTLVPLFNQPRPPRNIVILAHQGRKGQPDCTTLHPHFEHCRSKLKSERIKTFYVWDELTEDEVLALGEGAITDNSVLDRIGRLRDRTVLLLENVRLSEAEEECKGTAPEDFANSPLIRLLSRVENRVVALDGFSVAHRAQPSVLGLASLGPLYAGPVAVREIDKLSKALSHPEPPMLLIVGGAKTDDSLQSIERFMRAGKAHKVLTGGLVGLTFLLADGFKPNKKTLANIQNATKNLPEAVARARGLLDKHGSDKILIPIDLAIGPKEGFSHTRETFSVPDFDAKSHYEIGDIGIETMALYLGEITRARTIVMNGTMGRYEWQCFLRGTREILRYVAFVANDKGAHALIGGGDTGAALGKVDSRLAKCVEECSSGKAFLQVLASGDVESLVGIRALARKADATLQAVG